MGTIAQDFTTDAQVVYNGYTFSPAMDLLRVEHKPIYDQARRTVTHTVTTLRISDIIQASDQTDGTKIDTTALRRQLTVPGQQLTVTGVGLGAFQLNLVAVESASDVMWGPLPQGLEYEPYGNGKAAKITWTCQVAMAEQCDDAQSKTDPMAYCYDATFTKDNSGYGRRVINGYVEIPMTRDPSKLGGRLPPDSVDRLREQCYPDVPVGWKRTGDSWKVSMDRRRADFTYTDEEQPPNAPAAGVVNCEESQEAECSGRNLIQWTTTLSGTYEMTKARSRAESWIHFTKFAQSRIEAILAAAKVVQGQKDVVWPIPIGIRIQEPVHGRTSGSYSITLTYNISPSDFTEVIKDAIFSSGLFTAPPESDYKAWKTSLSTDGVFTARGVAKTGLAETPDQDTIIDLCINTKVLPTAKPTVQVSAAGGSRTRAAKITLAQPPAPNSFLGYELGMRVEEVDTVAELKPLPATPIQYLSKGASFDSIAGYSEPYPNTPASVFQLRAGSSIVVTLYGAALRAGYDVNPPVLLALNGVPVVRANRKGNFFQQRIWGNYGVPIVEAVWSQRYLVQYAPRPGSFGAPANPLYGSLKARSSNLSLR